MFGGLFSTFSDVEQKIAFLLYQVSRKIQFKIKLWSSCDTKHLINDNTTFNHGFLLGLFDWACSHKEVLKLETYETLVELFLYEPHLYDQLVAGFKNSVVQLKNDVQTNVGLRGYHTAQTIVAVVEVVELVSLVKNIPKTAGKIGKFADGVKGVVSGAGSVWKTFLDDAFTLSKRAEVAASSLPTQFPNLTIDELTAIKVYTSDQMRNGSKIYQTLNTELRAGNLSDYNKGLNDLLNNGLSKLPSHNGNIFRGVYGQEATLAKTWQVGEEIPFKDFKSSSINRQTAAYEFSYNKGDNVVYEIIGGKGSNVCGISCIPNEMEVMLKSGQKFKVKEIKNNFNIPDPLDPLSNNPFKVIVLEIVN